MAGHLKNIPLPSDEEDFRELAVAIDDGYYVVGLIVRYRRYFIPGESVDELKDAWDASLDSFQSLADILSKPDSAGKKRPPHDSLEKAGLTGDAGKAKKRLLARLRDRFLGWWNSKPRTKKKYRKAAEAAVDYLEFLKTLIGSLGNVLKEVPGYGAICESINELLDLVKLLLGLRAKRGY